MKPRVRSRWHRRSLETSLTLPERSSRCFPCCGDTEPVRPSSPWGSWLSQRRGFSRFGRQGYPKADRAEPCHHHRDRQHLVGDRRVWGAVLRDFCPGRNGPFRTSCAGTGFARERSHCQARGCSEGFPTRCLTEFTGWTPSAGLASPQLPTEFAGAPPSTLLARCAASHRRVG